MQTQNTPINPPFDPNADVYPFRRWGRSELAVVFRKALERDETYADISRKTGLNVKALPTRKCEMIKSGLLPKDFALRRSPHAWQEKTKEDCHSGIIFDYLFGGHCPLNIALKRGVSCDDVCRFLKNCGFDPDPHAARPALPESE